MAQAFSRREAHRGGPPWGVAVLAVGAAFAGLADDARAQGTTQITAQTRRVRQTFDGLLATPLENREILFGKWLGSIFGPRRAWLGMAVVWSVGLVTGALHPLAPVCFVLAWFVYASFLAALGLWASVANRSTHRATFLTLLLLVAATVAWAVLGPFVDFSSDWLLVPSALASIVALLLVVLLQYSQNRDTRALQLKLDEVIRALGEARSELLQLERRSDEELAEIEEEFERLREEEAR